VRIAITHPYSWPDVRRGAERIMVETAESLAARGHDVTVLTSGSRPGRSRSGSLRTIRLRRLFGDNWRHERSFGYRIVPYLVAGRFDIVHSISVWDAYCAVRARRLGGYRVVFDDMGIPNRAFYSVHPEGPLRERLVRDVDVYGCMSHHALEALRRDWGREGSLIPGGVRLSQFAIGKEREPVPTVLFSGTLEDPRKGLDVLLEAVAIAARDSPELRLWLSGPGNPEPILANAPPDARQRVEVLPIGKPEDQGRRYARAWVTALPSVSDSFGLVLLESLASGTPIVVVNDAAPPSLVTPATGAIANPKDPRSLAKALRRGLELATGPDTARVCREFAEKFDWDDSIAPLLEDIYGSATSGSD
jgi:phosphatidylinositol alpha-mannosyltransferase